MRPDMKSRGHRKDFAFDICRNKLQPDYEGNSDPVRRIEAKGPAERKAANEAGIDLSAA